MKFNRGNHQQSSNPFNNTNICCQIYYMTKSIFLKEIYR